MIVDSELVVVSEDKAGSGWKSVEVTGCIDALPMYPGFCSLIARVDFEETFGCIVKLQWRSPG